MSKIRRGGPNRSNEGEPLSAGRVEYLEAARARARNKNIRRTVVIVVVLTLFILLPPARWGLPLRGPRMWWTRCTSH